MSRLPSSVCYVLREDPELAEGLAPAIRSQAIETVVAREVQLPAGAWPDRRLLLENGLGLPTIANRVAHGGRS